MNQPSPERTRPTVHLRHGEADRIQAGHPWIYARNISKITQDPKDGDVVQVRDHRRRFLGIGLYHSGSKLRVRLVSKTKLSIDASFFQKRIQNALDWRQRHVADRTCYRLINSESDGLSGLIVDRYGDVLVLQTSSLGMDNRLDLIVEALREVVDPAAILERNNSTGRRMEGLPEKHSVLFAKESSKTTPRVSVEMNALSWEIDVEQGHKTAVYLDQYENYQKVGALAARMHVPRVLDCFTFMGGFALHCAKEGAESVVAIDQSEEALQSAQSSAEKNGLAEKCQWVHGNVFDWLKQQTVPSDDGEKSGLFDLIILDPPSFTRNRSSIPDALRGYKEIHLRAIKLLKPNGILATFCCSHHIDALTFEGTVLAAASDNRCVLRRVESFGQPADHPIVPTIPESEYLKGFAYQRLDF